MGKPVKVDEDYLEEIGVWMKNAKTKESTSMEDRW
jgi:hypothetical protein